MLIPSLLTTLLAIQAPHEPQDPFRQGSACLSCHEQPVQQAIRGHEPYRLGNCQACHSVPADDGAGWEGLGQLQKPGATQGSFIGSRPDLGGSFVSRHIRQGSSLGPARSSAGLAQNEPSFVATHRLLHQDSTPTNARVLRLAEDALGGADFVWIRADSGDWQKVPVETGSGPLTFGDEPELDIQARLRRSALGSVAVLEIRSDVPVAAVARSGGGRPLSLPEAFTSDQTLRVTLGAGAADLLPVTIHTPDGRQRVVDVRLADASARRGSGPLAARAVLAAGAAGGGMLELWTPVALRLEVRAPAEGERALEAQAFGRPSRIAADAGRRGVSGGAGGAMHASNAPVEHSGYAACLSCHPKAATKGASHPLVQMRAGGGFSIPETLPMAPGGQMLCITCHDPHGGGEYRQHMRMDPDRELCIQCHTELR